MKKIDDILTQLQQQQPDVSHPDELTDRIMESLPDMDAHPANDEQGSKPARRARLYIFSAIAVAASVLLFLVLHLNPGVRDDKTVASSEKVRTQRKQIPHATKTNSAPFGKGTEMPAEISRRPSVVAEVRKKKQTNKALAAKHPANAVQARSMQPAASTADSLDYYIAKIERELTQVDESLYIERMRKLIHADERLQRIVNNYLFHQLDKDGRPVEAIHTNNVNTTENEE